MNQHTASGLMSRRAALQIGAGMFGMNLEGIPGHQHYLSFASVVGILAVVMALEYWLLRRLKWI